jgi:hypothetical protein
MTKNKDFQRELKEKVKEGVKPSQLKRSKSLTDIPTQPKSETITRLERELALAHSQLEPLTKLTEKQDQQIKDLEKDLKEKDEKITELNTELDKSLEVRLKNLKQPLTSEQTNQLKSKIALLENTLKLQRYNNS